MLPRYGSLPRVSIEGRKERRWRGGETLLCLYVSSNQPYVIGKTVEARGSTGDYGSGLPERSGGVAADVSRVAIGRLWSWISSKIVGAPTNSRSEFPRVPRRRRRRRKSSRQFARVQRCVQFDLPHKKCTHDFVHKKSKWPPRWFLQSFHLSICVFEEFICFLLLSPRY